MTDLAVPRRPAMAIPPMPAAARLIAAVVLVAAHYVDTVKAKAQSMQRSSVRNAMPAAARLTAGHHVTTWTL